MRGTGVLCGEVFLYYAGISAVEFPLSVCLFSHAFEAEYLQQRFQNVLAHFTFQRADCHFREKGEEGTYHCGGEVMFLCKPANLLKGCNDIPLQGVGTAFLFLLIVIIVINDSIVRIVLVGWISGGAIDERRHGLRGRDGGEWCLLDLVEVEDVADPCQNPFSVGNLFPFGIPVAVGNLFCVVVFLCHNHLVLVVSILIVQSYKLFKQCYCYFKTFA